MTEQEKETMMEEILEQLKFDSLLIEDLTPVLSLKDTDKFELDGGRYIEFARLLSEIRFDAVLDKYRHVDRGNWKEGEMYYAGVFNPDTGLIETSHVWYCGCKFRCLVTGTTNPPRWDCTDWEFEEGDPMFRIYLTGGLPFVRPTQFRFTLVIVATRYNQDVTSEILPEDVAWTRYSEDRDGNERTASDNIWATRRGASGLSIELTQADLDTDINGVPPICIFRATVILRDGEEPTTVSLTYGYNKRQEKTE